MMTMIDQLENTDEETFTKKRLSMEILKLKNIIFKMKKKNSLVELNSRSELAEEKIDKLEYGSVWSIQSKEQKEKGIKKSKHPQRPVST